MVSSSQRPLPDITQHSQQTDIHVPRGIRTHNLSRRVATELRLRPLGHWDRNLYGLCLVLFVAVPFIQQSVLRPVHSAHSLSLSLFFFFYFLGKDYKPCFTKRYTTGYLQYLCTSVSGLTVLFVAVLPWSYDCVKQMLRWFKQILRWFPRFQVATTCFSCSPPDLNSVITNLMFCIHVK